MGQERLRIGSFLTSGKELALQLIKEEKGSFKEGGGYLILERKINQGILGSNRTLIRVFGMERGRVKIGIKAPGTAIVRDEALDTVYMSSANSDAKGFLVLMRKVGQVIRVGDDVKVKVTKIEGDRAKIGIEAPREITFVRDELVDAKDMDAYLLSQTPNPDLIGRLFKKR